MLVAAMARELVGHAGFVCGVGPVSAAATTAKALHEAPREVVLHIGLAGARRDCGVVPPQLVIGSKAVYEDRLAPHTLPEVVELVPDAALVAVCRRTLPNAPFVPIGTTARIGGGNESIEAMEGYGVLFAAAGAGSRAVEVRAVSNFVDEPWGDWDVDAALATLSAALPALIVSIRIAATRDSWNDNAPFGVLRTSAGD